MSDAAVTPAPAAAVDPDEEDPEPEAVVYVVPYARQVALATLLAPLPAESVIDLGDIPRLSRTDTPLEIPMRRGSRWEALLRAAGAEVYERSAFGREKFSYDDLAASCFSSPPKPPLSTYRYWRIGWAALVERRLEVLAVADQLSEVTP